MVKYGLPSQVRQVDLRREQTDKAGLIVGNEGILKK
jgi:hypothetical protein